MTDRLKEGTDKCIKIEQQEKCVERRIEVRTRMTKRSHENRRRKGGKEM